MGPGRTGRHNRVVRPLEPILDRHLTGNQVDQRPGNKEGRHTTRAFFGHHQRGLFNGLQTANARPDHHTGAQLAFLILGFPPGILNGLSRRRDPIEDKVINLAPFLGRHPVIGIKRAVAAIAQRNLTGIFRGDTLRIEPGDRPGARRARQQTRPGFFDPRGQRCDQAKPGDDNATHDTAPFEFFQMLLPRRIGTGQGRHRQKSAFPALSPAFGPGPHPGSISPITATAAFR